MDLRPLFESCRSADPETVERQLACLKNAALTQRGSCQIANVEIAFDLRRALAAWRAWQGLARRPPDLALGQLLAYASERVPFYRQRLGNPVPGAAPRLADFAPVTRADMAGAQGDFFPVGVNVAADSVIHLTSGTTGRPLVVWIPPAMFYDMCYALYAEAAELVPGTLDRVYPDGCSVVQLSEHPMTWAGSTRMLPLRLSTLRRVMFDKDAGEAERILAALDPPIVSGTPSTLLSFVTDAGVTSTSARPSLLLVSGERLHRDQQSSLEAQFGCPCLDAYISSEGGAIALSDGNAAFGFRVRAHAVRLEVLTASGKIADEGTGEILLTNLLNHAMPFIRYRTGDFGSLRFGSDGKSQILSELCGKDLPGYDIAGRFVEAGAINALLYRHGVRAFRLLRDAPTAFSLAYEQPRAIDDRALAADLSSLLGGAAIDMVAEAKISRRGRKTVRFS